MTSENFVLVSVWAIVILALFASYLDCLWFEKELEAWYYLDEEEMTTEEG